MNNVYVLMNETVYEGGELVGVYGSLDDAIEAKDSMDEFERADRWAIWELELGQKLDTFDMEPVMREDW